MTKKDREKEYLEKIYKKYNHHRFIYSDPLKFLYEYKNNYDIEIVGFITSLLAYGRVNQIFISVKKILDILGDSPRKFLLNASDTLLHTTLKKFKHRFTTGQNIANLLIGLKKIILEHSSLENSFMKGFKKDDKTIVPALTNFCNLFYKAADNNLSFLLPSPQKKSACKRINLFLRWMIRKDNVDLGIWNRSLIPYLLIPLDTHMFKISRSLRFTKRKTANLKTVLEITEKFKEIEPLDPIKYDFALTRSGILKNLIF